MISITRIGNESQLSSQYPDIENFYNNTLKLHRISVTDRLFLSVLELPALKDRKLASEKLSATTVPENLLQSELSAKFKQPEVSDNAQQPENNQYSSADEIAEEAAEDLQFVENASAVHIANTPDVIYENGALHDMSALDESKATAYAQDNLAQDGVSQKDSAPSTSNAERSPQATPDTYTNADVKSFWAQSSTSHDDSETLVIVPGRAENEHKYAELLYNLRDSGLRVVVCFVRGQGQSSNVIYGSTKCHVEFFANYRHDLETMLNYLNICRNYKMLGFSLGGLICLDFCFFGTYPCKPQALGLVSPFLGVNYPIPSSVLYYTISALCLIRAFALSYTPHGREYKRIPFEDNYHSHSLTRYTLYHDYYADHPQQAISGPSFNFVKCCMRAQRKLMSSKLKFDFPVMCLSSELDKVVSTQDAETFFTAHRDDPVPPVFETIQGAFHDVLNEADEFRNPCLSKILDFLFPNSVNLIDPKSEQEALEAAQQEELAQRLAQPLDVDEVFYEDEEEPQASEQASENEPEKKSDK